MTTLALCHVPDLTPVLADLIPEAARAAWRTPATIVWHFQRENGPSAG
ncbi:MAG TPA: hypothetical protein VH372_22255 [Actinospica sp.]|nr:hypothetical protein [Actinospica sp.]